ncbi:SLBB domain-containing protein [Rubritalea spongiae]|uniref:SLBB domain-containing protein n=1 Tax=Rubritalea spongiae TaxID=430797 RepID=A0ABW5E3L6_9BACT
MKKLLALTSTLASFLLLNSCQWTPEQGPTNMDAIHDAQKEGKFPTNEYVIIDVNNLNITEINKPQIIQSNSIPKTDLIKTYADAIRPYDKLALQVIDTAETGGFSSRDGRPVQFGPIEVPQSGKISIPYAGDFNVIGKEITDVQNEIQNAYSTVFNTAQVSLNRISRLPLTANVIGIANKPGQQQIDRKGVTLADLVAKSGGTAIEPFTCEYKLHREGRTYLLNNKEVTTKNILAQDGDILEIQKSDKHAVTILGAVNRPGSYPFPNNDARLADFIGQGGGVSSNRADVTGVFVFRKTSNDSATIFRFNLSDPSGVIYASRFLVHGDDIVYVTEAPLARWNRMIRNILPFSQVSNFSRIGTAF